MGTRIVIESDDRQALTFFFDLHRLSEQISEFRQETRRSLRGLAREDQAQTADLTALIAAVAEGKTLDESIKALIEGLAGEDQSAAVQALAAQLKERREELTAAVQRNLPV